MKRIFFAGKWTQSKESHKKTPLPEELPTEALSVFPEDGQKDQRVFMSITNR
ncbi:hypothetical protein LFML04_0747 [Leptospirillum ferriphilum ML-04]|uniref:Uncharacterized protein n=1 Tax=Leptospirillum ferriphilum (strain ML-04) TaxID=1048260 RepID=J9Z9Y1_LEPFM|nr:hypothetical protein LFML04_0747 [Leptospirillum ferriphilum ML-04]